MSYFILKLATDILPSWCASNGVLCSPGRLTRWDTYINMYTYMYILEIGLRSTVRSLECLDVQKCVHIYVYIYIYRETNVFFENMIRQKYGEIVPSPRGSILHASRASHLPYYATTVFLRGGTRPIPGAIIYMYTYTYISLAGVLYSVLGHPLGSFSFWYCFEPFENWPPATLLWPWLLNAVWPCYMER